MSDHHFLCAVCVVDYSAQTASVPAHCRGQQPCQHIQKDFLLQWQGNHVILSIHDVHVIELCASLPRAVRFQGEELKIRRKKET